MKEKATYQDDFEGVYLMHTTFPSGQHPTAVKALEKNDKIIQKAASKLFTSNYALFNKIGMDREDVASIFRAYAYSYFVENQENMNFFNRFLRQRSLRLIETCERKAEGIAEERVSLEIEALVVAAAVHNDNPEQILMAREGLREVVRVINGTLVKQASSYAISLHLKGKLGKIPVSHAIDMATIMAVDYAAKTIQSDTPIDDWAVLPSFKIHLTSKFSKALGKIR